MFEELKRQSNRLLFSYHSIFDEDLAALIYVLNSDNIDDLFDLDKIKEINHFDFICKVYDMKESNPLYVLPKKEGVDNHKLDKLYESIRQDKDIIDKYAVSTEIYNLILKINDNSIKTTVFYYEDYQRKILENDKTLSDKVSLVDINKINIDDYDSFYFKYVYEAKKINLEAKSIYFSTIAKNFVNDKIIDDEYIESLLKKHCNILVYDLYNMKIIRKNPNKKENKNG